MEKMHQAPVFCRVLRFIEQTYGLKPAIDCK